MTDSPKAIPPENPQPADGQSDVANKPMPDPPETMTVDADQISAAERRWDECPLKDCKRNPELLYEDFYLRDIRTDRLMCSACATRTEVGYMAREVVRQQEDRFFAGTNQDYAIVAGIMFGFGLLLNVAMLFFSGMFGGGFFGLIISFFVAGAAGGFVGNWARRVTGKRVGRYSPQVAVGALAIGALLAPPVFFLLRVGVFALAYNTGILLQLGVTTFAAGSTIYSMFLRRI